MLSRNIIYCLVIGLFSLASCDTNFSVETTKQKSLCKEKDCETSTETSSSNENENEGDAPLDLQSPSIAVAKSGTDKASIQWTTQKGAFYTVKYAEGTFTSESDFDAASSLQSATYGEASDSIPVMFEVSGLKLDRRYTFKIVGADGNNQKTSNLMQHVPGAILTEDWSAREFGQSRREDYRSYWFGNTTLWQTIDANGNPVVYRYFPDSGTVGKSKSGVGVTGNSIVFGNRVINFRTTVYDIIEENEVKTTITPSFPSGFDSICNFYFPPTSTKHIMVVCNSGGQKRLVATDINTGAMTDLGYTMPQDSYTYGHSTYQNHLSFATYDKKIVVTDGTLAGTRVAYTIGGSETFQYMASMGEYYYFSTTGYKLYRGQFGSAAAPVLMANLQFSDPSVFNGKIYFKHTTNLYAYDPNDAEAGCSSTGKSLPIVGSGCFTRVLTEVSGAGGQLTVSVVNGSYGQMVPPSVGNKLVVFARNGTGQKKLWQTDGTVAGTSVAHQITGGFDEYVTYIKKIPGTDDLFHYNVSGSTITMWRFSALTSPQIQSFVTIPGTCLSNTDVDITKTKMRIYTCEQILYEVDLTTRAAKLISDRNISNAIGFGSDGLYYFDAVSLTGKLFRRNFDKTVQEITGLDLSKRGYVNYSVINRFSEFDSKTLTIGCASSTDCDLYQVNGTSATKWAEFPANSMPSGGMVAFNGTNYITDSNTKLYSVSNAGSVAAVTYNSAAITGVEKLNVGSNEMIFASNDYSNPGSIYRMTSSALEKIYTQPTVSGAAFYYVNEESKVLNGKRHFYNYYTDSSYTPFFSFLSLALGSNSVQVSSDSLHPYGGGDPVAFAGRLFFQCFTVGYEEKMCSDNLTFTDRRVEFTNSSSAPFLVGDKLFGWRYTSTGSADLWMVDAAGNLSRVTMPSGVTMESSYTTVGKYFLFSAYSEETGSELYITDGTTTKLLYDLASGPLSSFPNIQGLAGDELVVSVEYGTNRGLIFLDVSNLK